MGRRVVFFWFGGNLVRICWKVCLFLLVNVSDIVVWLEFDYGIMFMMDVDFIRGVF